MCYTEPAKEKTKGSKGTTPIFRPLPYGGGALIKLIGILIVIIGATFEFNLLLTILLAAFITGLVGNMEFIAILETIGNAFTTHRFLSTFLLILPLLGLLERRGLHKKVESVLRRGKDASVGRILWLYMTMRQLSVALGVLLGGHPLVRSLVAPMAEEAARRQGNLLPSTLDRVKAMAIATENCGNFFGQLLFVASTGGLLVKAAMEQAGYPVSIMKIALYGVPTALAAYAIVVVRCRRLDEALRQEAREAWQD